MVRDAKGHRSLLAVAGDWRVGADTLIEAEFETSRRSQPSVPGFSLLGDKVPAPVDPRINLNNQAWSLPVVLDGDTASLRWRQKISDGWQFTAHAATQRLRSDDRIAFPFGLDCNETSSFTGVFYCDRYGPDGRVDIYDFRSENERRRTDALDLSLQGKLRTGTIEHALAAGVLQSRVKNRFQDQTFAFSGIGNVDGSIRDLPANPGPNDANTNRDERSTELSLRDAITFDERSTLWLGLRHTRLHRESVRTDAARPTNYAQSFSTPFIAASYAFAPQQFVYASWSRGIESEVAPNRSRYVNAGQALPALKSRQAELGVKGSSDLAEWSAALFDIHRPLFADLGTCDVDNSCVRQADGEQHHRGIEASVATRLDAWTVRAGAQWLRARVQGVSNPAVDGKEPTNVPARTLKLQADYRVAALPGLSLQGGLIAESRRMVLPDNSAQIPGYARTDLGARYEQRVGTSNVVWRAGVENLADRRAWRESPYQFGHAYLFPLAARTWRLSVQADL
jgi:iron complex outermembrane receptor protein